MCNEYVKSYRNILDRKDALGDRLIMVRYSDFVQGKNLEQLEKLGLGKVYPDKAWSNSITKQSEDPSDAWMTPLYGKPLSSASINSYRTTLPVQLKSIIRRTCGPIAKELELELGSSGSAWPVRVSTLKNAVTFGLHTTAGVRTRLILPSN